MTTDDEKETRRRLDALYAAILTDWLGPGSYTAKGFDEALTAARAAGEKGYRGSLGRRETREQAAEAWRAAFTDRFRDWTMTKLGTHRNRAGTESKLW